MNQGVADPRLTTWLLRLIHIYTTHSKIICIVLSFFSQQYFCCPKINDPDGNRTRVTAVKGRCLNRLTTGPLFSSSVAEPFLILSYNFYNCKSFFLILSIFLLKFFTVFYDFLKLIFYSFFENISYVPYSIVLSLIYTAKLPAG